MSHVACIVMLKNERTLTPRFLAYHMALFGIENIYVFDNGSTDPEISAELFKFELAGGHVRRDFTTSDDFHRKGTIIGDLIKLLDAEQQYDFYIPLDCDEFVVLRTLNGYTAEPEEIHAYLDGLRGDRRILHVTQNLSNLLGTPDTFRVAEYSKTIWPREVFLHMDHGYHTGLDRNDSSPYVVCDIVYAHFHYRPYEEVIKFAKQKLRVALTDAQIEDRPTLSAFRGIGWHMTQYILDGPGAYYAQFRNPGVGLSFPGLGARFRSIGIDAPFGEFRLPDLASAERQPLVLIDEATVAKIRGWALDPGNPAEPMRLRFLLDGIPLWEGPCDQSRPDVKKNGQLTDRVGFSFEVDRGALGSTPGILSITDALGTALNIFVAGQNCPSIPLAPVSEAQTTVSTVHSHIDSFRNARVQGWVLRTVITPAGSRLLGCCTVVLVHDGLVVAQQTADALRPDVALALNSEDRCGFTLEVPRAFMAKHRTRIFRVFCMPEQLELAGSPCVLAPSLAFSEIAVN